MKLMPEAREKQKQKTKRCYNVGGGGIMCVISVIPVYLFIAPAACLPQPQTLFKRLRLRRFKRLSDNCKQYYGVVDKM